MLSVVKTWDISILIVPRTPASLVKEKKFCLYTGICLYFMNPPKWEFAIIVRFICSF